MKSLTYIFLETCYQSCVFGYEEPDILVLSPRRYLEFIVLVSITLLNNPIRKITRDTVKYLNMFNNAEVKVSEDLDVNELIFINSKRIEKGFTTRFTIE